MGEAEVSALNSDLTNFVHAQRVDENIKWIMYFGYGLAMLYLQERYSCSAFLYLKGSIHRRINTSKIFHGAAIPITLTKN